MVASDRYKQIFKQFSEEVVFTIQFCLFDSRSARVAPLDLLKDSFSAYKGTSQLPPGQNAYTLSNLGEV